MMPASSLPHDLIATDIFPRLSASAVISCVAVCRAWRRAIIGNASRLRPHRDRFFPDLLLAFFGRGGSKWLQRVPGPFQSALPVNTAYGTWPTSYSLMPLASAHGVDLSSYCDLLSSRDGFLLLRGGDGDGHLCLYNPITGETSFLPLPNAELVAETYVLVNAGDGIRILAAAQKPRHGGGRGIALRYQLFSVTSSAWGPVVESPELLADDDHRWDLKMGRGTEAVCGGGAVHWIAESIQKNSWHRCIVAVDMRTGHVWKTEMPEHWRVDSWVRSNYWTVVLATSRDGELSMVRLLLDRKIQVWVLGDNDKWILRRMMYVTDLLRNCNIKGMVIKYRVSMNAFCSSSGWLLIKVDKVEILVDVERGSARRIMDNVKVMYGSEWLCPYEMNLSTYIARMKQF